VTARNSGAHPGDDRRACGRVILDAIERRLVGVANQEGVNTAKLRVVKIGGSWKLRTATRINDKVRRLNYY
jgi:hypothetical protein